MALESKVYRALESVVGPENISEDPSILLGYAFGFGNPSLEGGKLLPEFCTEV
jgi:hypothetical protein